MKKRKSLRGRKALTQNGQTVIFHGLPVVTSGDMSEKKLQALEKQYGCSIRRVRTPTIPELVSLLDESIARIERGDWAPDCELPYCAAQVLTGCRDCPARDDRCEGFSQEEDLIFFGLLREILPEKV
jgi:hypothetical protein